MKTVLILGANSDMAKATADLFAKNGHVLVLAGRNEEKLNDLGKNLEIVHKTSVRTAFFDAMDFDSHLKFYQNLNPKPDITICVFGYLGDQAQAQNNWTESKRILDTNYTGAVSVLNIVASDYEEKKEGTIVGISSVAGERGRMSNYLYGSAKAGFTAYLSGLRNRLFHSGVHVLTVKPGFVNTRMTEDLDLPGPLTAQPEQVAKKIYKAVKKRKNSIYVLPLWRWVMLIIRNIPEFIFKKLKL